MSRYREHVTECRTRVRPARAEVAELNSPEAVSLLGSDDLLRDDRNCGDEVPCNSDRDITAKVTDLCRKLEGVHRCSKTAIDSVVSNLGDILASMRPSINLSGLENDKERLHIRMQVYMCLRPR